MTDEPDMTFTIRDDDGLYYFEVGRDKDDLECFEIRYYEERDGEYTMEDHMVFDPTLAKQLHVALGKLLEYYGDESHD